MMDYLLAKSPINLAAHLKRPVNSHQAVMLGIATHVQKEHARREDVRRQLRANSALKGKTGHVAAPA